MASPLRMKRNGKREFEFPLVSDRFEPAAQLNIEYAVRLPVISAFGIVGDEDGGWRGVHDGFEFGGAGTRSDVARTEQVFRPLQLDISVGKLVNGGPQVSDVALRVAGDAAADKADDEQVQVDEDE